MWGRSNKTTLTEPTRLAYEMEVVWQQQETHEYQVRSMLGKEKACLNVLNIARTYNIKENCFLALVAKHGIQPGCVFWK